MKVSYVETGAGIGKDFRGNLKDSQQLLIGEDDTPDNYRLGFSRQQGPFFSPRHKHNFDQIRMILGGGGMSYGPDQWIQPGELVYFPEGTPYGPQDYESERYGVTFQFGGASGQGYISIKRMREGVEALKQFGTFDKGVFTRSGELAPGMKRNRDSYEAVWEYINGRPLSYPKPRYSEPVLMRPKNFEWQPVSGQPDFSIKRLGSFSERQIEISILRVTAGGRAALATRPGIQLAVVIDGDGHIAQQPLRQHAAFSLEANEAGVLTATTDLELLLVGLPIFEREKMTRRAQSAA